MKKTINITKIIMFYIIVPIIFVATLYLILPIILNYPPNSTDNLFQREIDGITYTEQFLLNVFLCIGVQMMVLVVNIKKMNKILALLNRDSKRKQELLDDITKICLSTPLKIYFTQIIMPVIVLPIVIALIGADVAVVFKISIIFILFLTLSATMTYVLTQQEFKNLIRAIYEEENIYKNRIIEFTPKVKMQTKLALEFMPLVIVALMFTSLLSYTMNSKTVGDIYYKFYVSELDKELNRTNYRNQQDIMTKLELFQTTEDDSIIKFVIRDDGSYVTTNQMELSPFFVKYALQNQDKNRTYDYYCIDKEGTFVKIKTEDGNGYLVGVQYATNSTAFLYGLSISCACLLLIILINLGYITIHLVNDIKMITFGLNKIRKEKDLNKEIIVTTNDETGELTDAFNKIEKMTQENIKEINEKQELLIRQEKLSILGEMAGGMAHDINNPASAINMSISTLYGVNDEEQKKKILDNMKECIRRILAIVSSVRDQFRNIGETKKELFHINDVLKNIEIVIQNQLRKANCNLMIDYDSDFQIFGEMNKLNQVLSNIIMNSILAYQEIQKAGTIMVDMERDAEYNIIAIKDEAGGIPEKVKDKLFTQILTTRGTQGTGLGLYLAKSIIEDEFGGKIYFETETGKGTNFYIKLKKVDETNGN